MADIDYGLAYDFVDTDGRPRQLRFRRNYAPAGTADTFDGTGQLVAVIADAARPDNTTKCRSLGPACSGPTSRRSSTAGRTGRCSPTTPSTSSRSAGASRPRACADTRPNG